MVHLTAVYGAALASCLVWANLRFDLETPRSRLLLAGAVGFLVPLRLAPYLHGFATYLFEQLAPRASAAAQGDVVTAGLCGTVALVCWIIAATGAGGLYPRTPPPRPRAPETTGPT
ncbi:hypothetical protein [Nocardiopsis sp. CC223A]|uniref:hypothetical protein n=1 Tax=Nocardiopsis sp. CC223A TaxID=3044051 RepID=UPI00278BEDB8|nr:hypothetical protein [Nocardiopsis sp. CC223A]